MSKRNVPAIPAVPRNAPRELRPFFTAMREALEVRLGHRGNKLDTALTYRDLVESGVIKLGGLKGIRPGWNDLIIENPIYNKDIHAPTDFKVNSAIEGFFLSWGAPKYLGHAITRIYRTPTAHTDGTPDENPAFSEAFFVGTTMGNQYSDKQNITGGEGYTYWIRFSNLAGEYGPLSSSEGTFAVAGYDPAKLLEILTDRIDSSHLTQTLRGDITLITAEGGILEDYPILKEALGETVDDYINNNQTITQRISATESIVDTSSTQINTVAEGLIDSALQLDLANNKISTYLNDLNSFVDATFTVDPDSGSIELDAVNALRTETGTTFSQVTARFDAMDTTISLNATKADLSDYVSKLGTAGIDISGETPLVSIHASKIITEHGKPLDTKLSEAGIDVSGETGSINLSASSVNVDYAGSATNLATALNELYTAANAAIDLDGVTGVVSITAMNSAFSVIAPVWDEATTYGVGDPVIHNFKHWQATNPQTGTPPNTDRWLDLGTITGRFNSAENNINTAQNTANQALTGLTNKADSSTVGAIEDKQKIITADLEAVTETSRNQQSELWLSATTAIETALQNDANSNTVLASFSRFQDDVKTVASENEALAERTQLVEAELPGIKTRISDYRVASIKEHEASVTLITEAEARIDGKAQVAYSNITDAFVSADGVIAGRAETLEGAVFEDDGTTVRAEALFEDVVSMNIDSNSALASNFTSLSTSLGTKLAASTHNEFVLSFSDENSAVAAKIKDYHVTYRGASATMQEIAEAVVKETDSVAWSHYDHTLTHNLAAAKLTHDLGEVPEAGGDQDYTIEMQVIGNAANILVQTNVLKNVVFTLGGKTSSGEPEIIPDGNGAYWVTHVVKNVSPLVLATNSNLIVGRLVGCGSRIVKLNVTTQAIGSTHALWAVKQSVGDLKAGFGLYNNGSMTEFTVVADQFSVVNASGNGATAPFVIITNHSDPDVPDGVYIDEAFMNKATITELIANTVTADYVNAIDFHAISISGGTINIANAFTVGSNGGVIAKNITIMNDNNEVLLSSNTNRIAYSMISGGPPATADKTNYSDSRVNNNNVNYNNLFNRPSIPSSIADIDGDGVINKLENNIAMAGSEALAHQVYETYYSHITNSQGGVTGQYVGDSSYRHADFYLPSAGMVSVFVRGVSLGSGQRVEIRNTNSNSWTLMGTIPNLDMEYRTYSADMYVNGSGNYQVRVGGNGTSNNWYVLSSIKVVRIGDVDKTNYSDSRVNNNNVNYNNLFNRPSIPSSIADIDGDGVINQLELNVAMANSEALAHAKFDTYYGHITNSQGGVTGQYVGDSSYKYVDFHLPSAGMVSVFVRGASLGVGQRVEIRNTNSNSWTLMGTIPNLDMEYRTYSADMYVNGSGNYQVRVGGHGTSTNWYVLSSIKVVRIGDVDKTNYSDSRIDNKNVNYGDLKGIKPATNADKTNYNDDRISNEELTFSQVNNVLGGNTLAANIYAANMMGDVVDTLVRPRANSSVGMGESKYAYGCSVAGFPSAVPNSHRFTRRVVFQAPSFTVTDKGWSIIDGQVRILLKNRATNVVEHTNAVNIEHTTTNAILTSYPFPTMYIDVPASSNNYWVYIFVELYTTQDTALQLNFPTTGLYTISKVGGSLYGPE